MANPKAYIFDVFGTIVNWRNGVASVCAETFASKNIDFNPHEFADLWRGEYQPAMERIRSGDRGYIALDTLHLENLNRVLENVGLLDKFNNQERQALNKAWEKLPGWPDSSPGLYALKKKAIIAPCSNGSIALMTRIAKFSDLPWDCIVGAEIAQNYKPHKDAYLKSVAALGLQPEDVMMVAAHNDDLHAARKYGLKTGFIPRKTEYGEGQAKDLEPNADWDIVINSIEQLAEIAP